MSRQMRTWRVGMAWYVLVLVGPVILILLADVINIALGSSPPAHWFAFPARSGVGPGSVFWIIFGSLFAEELGWRGFGQPRLQLRYGALKGQHLHWNHLEHLASLDADHSGRSIAGDS